MMEAMIPPQVGMRLQMKKRGHKKGESLTSTWLINGLGRCPSIDVNARSRDCNATDALEL